MMKRYLVFSYECTEPYGGLGDLICTLDNINLLEQEAYIQENILSHCIYDFIDTLDITTGKCYYLDLCAYGTDNRKAKFDKYIQDIINGNGSELAE